MNINVPLAVTLVFRPSSRPQEKNLVGVAVVQSLTNINTATPVPAYHDFRIRRPIVLYRPCREAVPHRGATEGRDPLADRMSIIASTA